MGKVLAAIVVIALAFGVTIYKNTATHDTVVATVTEKERVNDKDSSKYLIFTDKEVFENTDAFWQFKFNSSDVYSKIKVGDTCTFHVIGWRLQFFSAYRNIITADCSA